METTRDITDFIVSACMESWEYVCDGEMRVGDAGGKVVIETAKKRFEVVVTEAQS